MLTFQQDLPAHPLTPSFNFTPMTAFKPSLDHLQALQQIFQTSNQSSLLQQPSLGLSKQSLSSNSCSNGFCQIKTSQAKNSINQKQIIDQAKALGINIVCVNCGQHDFKSLLERAQQDGEPFLLMNSSKVGQLNESTPSDPTQKASLSFYPLLSQQSPYQTNTNNTTNNPMNTTQSDPFSLSFFSTVSSQTQMPPSSSSSTSNKSSATSSISTKLFNQSSTLTKPTNNNNNNTNTLPFPQNNIPLFPYSDILYNSINKQQQQLPQPQQYQQFQQQQQQQLNFQQQLQNISSANMNSPFTSNNPLLQQTLSVPQFTLPQLFGSQEQTLKINLPASQNPKQIFQPVTLQPIEEAAQSGVNKPAISKPIELQQEEDDENEQYPSTKRISIASAASKQKRGLFKKRPSISQNKTQKEFKVKLEGDGSGSTSQNSSLSENLENDSDDSFSEGCQAAIKKQSGRRSTETNTQLTPAELEKQNKIRERRKTNNFGHIYTWLKNQIRLYYGDRELYEQIQTYFTRVNKYSEVVTDESSSKWQYFLFQIKDNSNLKEFLKDKIKSEHFREYIKTRKGKDQKVFYEFRIGVIYGIDHPELSNQPKNCLLMAKKDPEYSSIVFGW